MELHRFFRYAIIVDQSGNRWEWWRRCTFEEFRSKLLSEAEHRPEHIRLGQYIMTRTLQLFPDEATSPCGMDWTTAFTLMSE